MRLVLSKALRSVFSALCMAIYPTVHPVLSQVTFIYTAQYNKSQGTRTADEREVVSRASASLHGLCVYIMHTNRTAAN